MSLHKHLGIGDEHTIFEAELVGVMMGAHMASVETLKLVSRCLNNQAAITTTAGKADGGTVPSQLALEGSNPSRDPSAEAYVPHSDGSQDTGEWRQQKS